MGKNEDKLPFSFGNEIVLYKYFQMFAFLK